MIWLINDGSFAVSSEQPSEERGIYAACKWCGNATDRKSRKCDDCLRDLENDRRIDEARGK